jgi:aerobic carbon-monoxide dehydrogenase medium subunit
VKPPAFTYHGPATVEEATAVLADVGEDGKVLAGGQSLVPLLNFRLASPDHIVDINGIGALDRIDLDDDSVRVGAGVRHRRLERHGAVHAACPLLRQALVHVAHPVVRNRGTVCGSLAHADPAGELTAVLVLLDGTVHLVRRAGGGQRRRDVPGAAFFRSVFEADVAPDELVEAVTFRTLPARWGSAFVEIARRHGDYAVCGAGAVVELDPRGRIASARLAFVSVGPTPIALDATDVLGGAPPARARWAAVAERARAAVRPGTDIHATAEYRRHLAGVLAVRVLQDAVADARDRRDRRQEP